jgi:hypothetical protein
MGEDNPKVLAFPSAPTLPPKPAEIERGTERYCSHLSRIRLDEHARAVFCAECGASLDPFDFLHKSSRWITSAWNDHAVVTAEATRRRGEVDVLRKEAQRLKAQIKRMREKQPDTVLDCRRPL